MIIRFEEIFRRIKEIDRDLDELRRMREKIPLNRPFTAELQVAFDKSISRLLDEKISLEELEVEDPPADLMNEIFSVDVATASRIHVDRAAPAAEYTAREQKLLDFLRAIPKTEIHLHTEACVSKETILNLLSKNKVPHTEEEIDKLYKFNNLQEFIKLFLFILDSIRHPDDFTLIYGSLVHYLESNNIRYAEVFFAPSRLIQNGLDFNEMAQTLDILARESRLNGGPEVRFLVDVSRTFGAENASRNLQRVLACKVQSIIGIGLGGAELMGPARDFKEVFAQARANGLRTVAHAGEDDGPWSVRDAVEILRAERIGHGISAVQDPELLNIIRDRQIPVEICLTSNIFTGKYVRREQDHPVRRYYDMGIPCAINTDDPEIFNVDLSQEYLKLYKYLNFTVSELIDLVRQGVYSSFHPNPSSLWKSFQPEIQKLREEFDL